MSIRETGALEAFGFGLDPVVIRHYVDGIHGGKVLDVASFTDDVIRAGHIIVRETATDKYKPLPVSGGAFGSLPTGCEYAGVWVATTSKSEPYGGIMFAGDVNDKAMPYTLTDTLRSALKTAVPTLTFHHD